jgi:hypothetical protein
VGAGTTGLSAIIRRGTTTAGALVTTGSSVLVTAASVASLSGCAPDTPGAAAGQQYSLTLTGTGTTGAGTTNDVVLMAFSL